MNAVGLPEKVVDKRTFFVTMGCKLFPYERIKELLGEKGSVNFDELLRLPLLSDEKIVALEELGFFPPPMMRMLALSYARSTFRSLCYLLHEEHRETGEKALQETGDFLLAGISREALEVTKANVQSIVTRLIASGVEEHRHAIGCLEIILSVTKWSAQRSMREASSIQRDLLGDAAAKEQLNVMRGMAESLYDYPFT
jgi:hypothetical protein